MIVGVRSTLPTFKSVTFRSGLNVLLADVTPSSTRRQTRNSAGKTSLVEIIHFLLGSDADKTSVFKRQELVSHAFTGVLRIGGALVAVTRWCDDDRKVAFADVSATPDWAGHVGAPTFPGRTVDLDAWRSYLGEGWFDLPTTAAASFAKGTHGPTFRSLVGYFARRRVAGGYATLTKTSADQQPWNWQVNLSYLLGLDWQVSRRFQELRMRRKAADVLRKAIKEGDFGEVFGTSAAIRPELARTEDRIARLRIQVENFRVHDSYRELADRAARLKNRLSEAAVELTLLDETIVHLERSMQAEQEQGHSPVERLYGAAGIELPGIALRRFEEVRAFQASVMENRRRHLGRQADEARERRVAVDRDMAQADDQRSTLLKVLEGKGAFEDLIRLREELGTLSGRAETLRLRLENAAKLESSIAQMKADGAALELELQANLTGHEDDIRRATVLVDEAIGQLYDDRTGNLLIEATRSGLKLNISIQGGGNRGGIDMMSIFCFDLMLLQVTARRLRFGPLFILHDSHLFDGVDARQVRAAIEYGTEVARRIGGQYIVLMNSDEFRRLGPTPEIDAAVLPRRLTDGEDGGLFGFRFG